MEVEERFILVAGLIGEPARAKMLWDMLDGRAHTAGELAIVADISVSSASNHLSKLLEAGIVNVEMQGRHRYYSFSNPGVAYVVEALAHLAGNNLPARPKKEILINGVKYCRTCYDHLAGLVGVTITEAMEQKGYLKKHEAVYVVTGKGWEWLAQLDIFEVDFMNNRRPLTRQCLDWSERRPHLAGLLGAILLKKMLQKKWFKKKQFSRELIVTSKGRQEAYELLGLSLQ